MFACRLALALGRTLAEVFSLSAAEFAVWAAYYQAHGFPADRLEIVSAKGAAAVAQTWGGRVKAQDLLAKFGDRKSDRRSIAAYFDGLAARGQ